MSTSGPVKIYTLSDPRTAEIRYVGKTVETLGKRLSKHCSCLVNQKEQNHRVFWIRSLLQKGLKPVITLIEEVSSDIWEEREKYWIKYYKDLGLNLVNSTEGGDTCNPEISRKVLKKLWKDPAFRRSHTGKYHHTQREEWKDRMRGDNNWVRNLTKKQKDEWKEKISKAEKGHPSYPKQRKAVSKANKKPKPLKQRLKISKGKMKLSDKIKIKIRKERKLGFTYLELSRKYDVAITTIFRIVNFKYLIDKKVKKR